MKRALYLLDQLRDVVQGKPGLQLPEITCRYRERLPRACDASLREPAPERLVDHVPEWTTGAARFRLQLGRYIVV